MGPALKLIHWPRLLAPRSNHRRARCDQGVPGAENRKWSGPNCRKPGLHDHSVAPSQLPASLAQGMKSTRRNPSPRISRVKESNFARTSCALRIASVSTPRRESSQIHRRVGLCWSRRALSSSPGVGHEIPVRSLTIAAMTTQGPHRHTTPAGPLNAVLAAKTSGTDAVEGSAAPRAPPPAPSGIPRLCHRGSRVKPEITPEFGGETTTGATDRYAAISPLVTSKPLAGSC